MNSRKIYFGLLGLIGVLIIGAIAALVFGNSILQKKSHTLVELKLENRVLEEQQASLIQANKDIEKYSELEAITKSIVPQDKDQAKSVREIINIASEAGVNIASVTFPNSTLGTVAPKAATKTEGSGDSSNGTAKVATPPVSQVTPVNGITGVYELKITVQSETADTALATFSELVQFLEKLENNRRTAQVSSITIQPNASDITKLSFSVEVSVFIKP